MAQYAWLIAVLPVLSWLSIATFGRRLRGGGALLGILASGIGFLFSLAVLRQVIVSGPVMISIPWLTVGEMEIEMGIKVDALAAMMLPVVTLVSTLVQLFSVGYMDGDVRYSRYFGTLSFFTFSMLGLVLADNLLLLFMFYELVGLASYLLIGHWYEKPGPAAASIKAFITTRIGDLGLLLGILALFAAAGTFSFDELTHLAEEGAIAKGVLTFAAVALFGGAVGKSAQFPLHVWLPDAMEGPTPVSALIHAATMVAAGVYLVARSFGIFHAAPEAMAVVAYIGGFTAIFAATIAVVASDVKKVMAYSTISQLGYMILALGVGAYAAGLFHLMTHAFFKALLFLGSGSVIHAMHTQEMHQMGGLYSRMKVTAWTFFIGAAALIGIPPLSGFWSKDEILIEAFHSAYPLVYWMAMLTVFLTAFYVTRAVVLTFLGKPRWAAAAAGAGSHGGHGTDASGAHSGAHGTDHHGGHGHNAGHGHGGVGGVVPHESPRVMTIPLIILAVLAATVGLIGSPLLGNPFGKFIAFGGEVHHAEPAPAVMYLSLTLAGAGILLAWLVYGLRIVSRERIILLVRPVYILLKNKYYLDEIYGYAVVGGALKLAQILSAFDQKVVDFLVNLTGWLTVKVSQASAVFDLLVVDGAVNGVAGGMVLGGRGLRRLQTGYVQGYLLAFAGGVALLLVVFTIW
ncbi:MAG: NADH-quinone oxidoreductase subunit L [Firmicutes bacterium]|nr:NADH-quinone oxidoreductase subunit L [Bacillota bacterium]